MPAPAKGAPALCVGLPWEALRWLRCALLRSDPERLRMDHLVPLMWEDAEPAAAGLFWVAVNVWFGRFDEVEGQRAALAVFALQRRPKRIKTKSTSPVVAEAMPRSPRHGDQGNAFSSSAVVEAAPPRTPRHGGRA